MATYQELAKDNQYLYGQMENCTQLMGLALLNDKDGQYRQFLSLKEVIKAKIEINLHLIEDLWNEPVCDHANERQAMDTNFRKEINIYLELKEDINTDIGYLVKKYKVTEVTVKSIMGKYELVA